MIKLDHNRWRTIITKTSNGIREGKIPPRSSKQRAGVSLRGDLCYDSWSLSHLGYLNPGTTPVMINLSWALRKNLSWALREHRAGCRCRPPNWCLESRLNQSPDARRSRNPSKSTLAHAWRGRRCSVAQAPFHHPRWCRLHPVCLSVALALGHGAHTPQSPIFAMVLVGFFLTLLLSLLPNGWSAPARGVPIAVSVP